LVYADDVNMLGGSVCTIKRNAEALVVASKAIGLEVNTDKTKYMVMSGDKIAGRSHNMNDNSSLGSVEHFRYFGTQLTNENSVQEEIKSGLTSRNAWNLSVQNLLSSRFVFKNINLTHAELQYYLSLFMGVKRGLAHIE
jgi:predicted nucleotide-binding protein (sugar kinase/HSP70/actin superfamily)